MIKCDKCSKYGLCFEREYTPGDFLWGKRDSLIWIVGLNPKERPGYHTHTVTELERYFDTSEKNRSYFQDFRKVSPKLFEILGSDNGAAHTDIVKCFSNEFPPLGCKGREVKEIISNCTQYFEKQLRELTPKLVLCNGSPVCKVIKDIIKPIKPPNGKETSYYGEYNSADITVILSGFIGRIDDYAKLRLGSEIEHYMRELGIT